MWQLALVPLLMWFVYRLSRDVIRALENQTRQLMPIDVLDSDYPVFSRARILEAYRNGVEASRDYLAKEDALREDADFKTSVGRRLISEQVAAKMLGVSEAYIAAEKAWYAHSRMMEANLSVLTGRHNREEALAAAEQSLAVLSKDLFGEDAPKLRDEWRARLEDPTKATDDSVRPYSNPWSNRGKADVWRAQQRET